MSDYEGGSKNFVDQNVRARGEIESEIEVRIEKKMVAGIHGSIRIEVEDLTERGTRTMAVAIVETKILTALFRWGVALQQRSRLRPSNGKEKVELLEQAKRLYEDALDMDSNNVQVREALSSCMLELGSRRLYS